MEPSTPKSILIVDDDPPTVELLTAMLEGKGWILDTAYSGEEALAKITETAFDVVLTDLKMPGIDGLMLLNRIHDIRPETPVVMMTAESAPSSVVASLRGKAFSYLTKPFNRETLICLMDLALGNAPEDDDIVVISARPEWISLRLKCKMATAERLTLFIRGLEMSLKAEERDMIAAVFRELLVNAIEHGGHSDPQLEVNLSYIRTSRSIIYYLRDPGPGFSIDAIPHAAVGNPDDPVRHVEIREAQGMRAGGFGILLSRNFADELIYSEKGNEVVFIKYLNHE